MIRDDGVIVMVGGWMAFVLGEIFRYLFIINVPTIMQLEIPGILNHPFAIGILLIKISGGLSVGGGERVTKKLNE